MGDYYYGYNEIGRSTLTNLGLNIISASHALYNTGGDPKVFIPSSVVLDDQGNTLTNKDFIIDASKITSYPAADPLTLLNGYLQSDDCAR